MWKKIFLNFNTLQLQRCDLFISKLCIFFFIATNTFKAKLFFSLCLGYLNDFHFILVQFFVWIFHISTFADGVLQSGGTSFYYRLDGSWCFFLSKFTILWLSQYHVFNLLNTLYTYMFNSILVKMADYFIHEKNSRKFCLKIALNSPNESLYGSILQEVFNGNFQRTKSSQNWMCFGNMETFR